ncbi:7,8-didemethyl-8-hydroxy-5-deazariboflavin synthase CofG [Subtercola frigoramans]|uniref:7,8-didemethyl-8-hydroxy-5-deazariboflavin synthase n=1 Tax=Subtercola frigoramans TaxID=120298 RepID=A0ABS2L2B8_9MICO|nr:7,8-didemethyl-8-hydroxy-5-deazariboflavin synthase CofG [Subtercola frigoramans]MBM7471235.1 FO synthase [Subtercola frigoramans]
MPSLPEIDGALHRARAASESIGHSITASDAETLLHARGMQLQTLLDLASALRDQGLVTAGRPGVITYSRKVFIPLTHLCQDRCHYCIFVSTPGKLAKAGIAPYLSVDEVLSIAKAGAALGCKEALFTLGDRPENRWPAARAWLDNHGYDSTIDYVRHVSLRVMEETGLLPHLNPGVMTWTELQELKGVAPSMGMMLETTATRLWSEKSGPHYGSPDKDPAVRLRVLDDAGRSKIPFTTGVLFGIGENYAERVDSILAIRASGERHGHIQETIVQNFRAKDSTAMMRAVDLETEEYVAAVAVTRLLLGEDARIQAPPNLTDTHELALLLRAGIDDWGGVSPLTPDHVNPERPWPQIDELAALTARSGFTLRERLTAHPHFVRDPDDWIDPAVLPHVLALADESGLARDGVTVVRPVSVGRVPETRTNSAPALTALLRRAETSPPSLSDGDYAELLGADGPDLDELCRIADELRRATLGDTLTFAINRNLDSALVRPERGAQTTERPLTLREVTALASEARMLGATEICLQGPAHPDLGPTAYFDLARAIAKAEPTHPGERGWGGPLHLHAFRPAEHADGARRSGLSYPDYFEALREAGVGSVPGTGARILDDTVRAALTGGTDLPAAEWVEIITAAHRSGLRSTATMIYGHIETAAQQVAHLRTLIRLHDETGGFTEFIPMPFTADSPAPTRSPGSPSLPSLPGLPARLRGERRTGPSERESRAVHAVSRLMLAGRIDHVQAAWTKLGLRQALSVLASGADDLGGLLLDGTLDPNAGAETGRTLTPALVERISATLGRTPHQRTTLYARIEEPARRAAGR